jgi:hypothetical protein
MTNKPNKLGVSKTSLELIFSYENQLASSNNHLIEPPLTFIFQLYHNIVN